jgi:hypothetical protein
VTSMKNRKRTGNEPKQQRTRTPSEKRGGPATPREGNL